MPGLSTNSQRPVLNNGLVGVAIAGALATVLALLVFVSGTSTSHGGGSNYLQLRDPALVSFDGVVPNNDTSEFLVHLRWFVSSFAWEYLDAPDSLPQAGFASKGTRFSSDVVGGLRKIAVDLKLPKESYYCPALGQSAVHCNNVFYEAWRTCFVVNGLSTINWIFWFMHIAAVAICLLGIAQEWMIRKRPAWMRCQCIIGKRYCPFPRGTKENMEHLDEHVCDKVRMWYWAMTASYFALPAIQSTFVASTLSFLCMLIKWRMSRHSKKRAQQQDLGQLERYID